MENLNLLLKLSLEEMALRRTVVNLWTDADVSTSIEEFRVKEILSDGNRKLLLTRLHEFWLTIVENEVKAKGSKLALPESLKKRMMVIVRPIGLQILVWLKIMEANLGDSRKYFDLRFLEHICWTSVGVIDYEKTASKLARLEILDAVTRYKVACSFCLIDSIPVLWQELHEDYKASFVDDIDDTGFVDRAMEYYWNYNLKGEESKLQSIFERSYISRRLTFHMYVFRISAVNGNKAATEYFFQKLTDKERNDCLLGTVLSVVSQRLRLDGRFKSDRLPQLKTHDVLQYLISVMSPEQQMHVFKNYPLDVLPCFLDWPLHDLFVDVSDLIWTFLPETRYSRLANDIHEKLRNADYYFPNSIQKFFLRSPRCFRKFFLSDFHTWFSKFSYAEDSETIEAILRTIDPEDRAQLVCENWFLQLLKALMEGGKWPLVQVRLREAAFSKEERQILKDSVDSFVIQNFEEEELAYTKERLKRCFECLDQTKA